MPIPSFRELVDQRARAQRVPESADDGPSLRAVVRMQREIDDAVQGSLDAIEARAGGHANVGDDLLRPRISVWAPAGTQAFQVRVAYLAAQEAAARLKQRPGLAGVHVESDALGKVQASFTLAPEHPTFQRIAARLRSAIPEERAAALAAELEADALESVQRPPWPPNVRRAQIEYAERVYRRRREDASPTMRRCVMLPKRPSHYLPWQETAPGQRPLPFDHLRAAEALTAIEAKLEERGVCHPHLNAGSFHDTFTVEFDEPLPGRAEIDRFEAPPGYEAQRPQFVDDAVAMLERQVEAALDQHLASAQATSCRLKDAPPVATSITVEYRTDKELVLDVLVVATRIRAMLADAGYRDVAFSLEDQSLLKVRVSTVAAG